MAHVFRTIYHVPTLDAARNNSHSLPALPRQLERALLAHAKVFERSGDLPPPAELATAKKCTNDPDPRKHPQWKLRSILQPREITTTFSQDSNQLLVDVVLRPVLTDNQIRRYIPRNPLTLHHLHQPIADVMGYNFWAALPIQLREITRWLEPQLYMPLEYRRRFHRGDIYSLWTYHPPTGPHDYNARASARFPRHPLSLQQLSQSYICRNPSSFPVKLEIAYEPTSSAK